MRFPSLTRKYLRSIDAARLEHGRRGLFEIVKGFPGAEFGRLRALEFCEASKIGSAGAGIAAAIAGGAATCAAAKPVTTARRLVSRF